MSPGNNNSNNNDNNAKIAYILIFVNAKSSYITHSFSLVICVSIGVCIALWCIVYNSSSIVCSNSNHTAYFHKLIFTYALATSNAVSSNIITLELFFPELVDTFAIICLSIISFEWYDQIQFDGWFNWTSLNLDATWLKKRVALVFFVLNEIWLWIIFGNLFKMLLKSWLNQISMLWAVRNHWFTLYWKYRSIDYTSCWQNKFNLLANALLEHLNSETQFPLSRLIEFWNILMKCRLNVKSEFSNFKTSFFVFSSHCLSLSRSLVRFQ